MQATRALRVQATRALREGDARAHALVAEANPNLVKVCVLDLCGEKTRGFYIPSFALNSLFDRHSRFIIFCYFTILIFIYLSLCDRLLFIALEKLCRTYNNRRRINGIWING